MEENLTAAMHEVLSCFLDLDTLDKKWDKLQKSIEVAYTFISVFHNHWDVIAPKAIGFMFDAPIFWFSSSVTSGLNQKPVHSCEA